MFRTEAEIVIFIKLVLSLDPGGGGRRGGWGGATVCYGKFSKSEFVTIIGSQAGMLCGKDIRFLCQIRRSINYTEDCAVEWPHLSIGGVSIIWCLFLNPCNRGVDMCLCAQCVPSGFIYKLVAENEAGPGVLQRCVILQTVLEASELEVTVQILVRSQMATAGKNT